MRLSEFEKQAIIKSVAQYLHCSYELFLYGSRADHNKKGGDIDLLILLQNKTDQLVAQQSKIQILVDLKNKIGDQKIDLMIYARSQLGTEPFLDLIYPEAVLLKAMLPHSIRPT